MTESIVRPAGSPAVRRRALRPYQVTAVADTVAQLRDGGCAQAHMACGTGKTLVALKVAEQAAPGDALIVVLAPTIALVAQLLAEWRADAELPFAALAVCSDDTVVDAPVHLADLAIDNTTDIDEVTAWLRATGGRRCVFGTYRSARVAAAAVTALRIEADLLVCDEAHHLTGGVDAGIREVVDPGFLPVRRRLYVTATPRIDMRMTAVVEKIGMDDEVLFGPRTAYYPFHQAIADGHLQDYRVAVIGVTEAEVRALLVDHSVEYVDGIGAATLRTLATQVALAKAQVLFGFRRVISFHYRVSEAADFARGLRRTLDRLPENQRPSGPLQTGFVHGEQSIAQRNLHLAHLRDPPKGGWTVISNSRCLGEGVDIPAVDAVAFGHAKRSSVDIVQAVGRGLRHHDDGTGDPDGKATIVIPIIVPQGDGEVADLDPREYSLLWNVVRALRAHDEDFGIMLDDHRAIDSHGEPRPLPDKITVVLPPGTADHVLAQITVLTIQQTTSPWWVGYGGAVRFVAEHGHLMPMTDWSDPVTGVILSRWLNVQRQAARRGRLPVQRRELLDQLDMVWEPRTAKWADSLAAAAAFRAEYGHLRVPKDYVAADGFELGVNVDRWRHRHRYGLLAAEPAAALEVLGIEWNDDLPDPWQQGLKYAQLFHAEHGHLNVSTSHRADDDYPLDGWIRRQRKAHRENRLSREQAAALNALGMVWDWEGERWTEGMTAAAAFRAEYGHLRVSKGYVADDGYPLGSWLGSRRNERKKGTLTSERVAALEALGMVWSLNEGAWEDNYAAAHSYYRTHGDLDVPHRYRDPETGARLGAWVLHQRQIRSGVKAGELSPDKVARLDAIGMIWTNKRSWTTANRSKP